jgi:periplasmic protein TonB
MAGSAPSARQVHWPALAAVVVLAAVTAAVFAGLDRPATRNSAAVPQRVALVDPPQAVRPPAPREEVALPESSSAGEEALIDDVLGDVVDDGPPALDDALGLEGDAEAGFDAFGLRAKRGGRDIMLDVQPRGRPFNAGAVTAFASRLATALESDLSGVPELRTTDYEIKLRVWVDGEGRVSRCEMLGTTGDRAVDARLDQAMDRTRVCVGPPPAEFPNPVVLLVRSRGAGQQARSTSR